MLLKITLVTSSGNLKLFCTLKTALSARCILTLQSFCRLWESFGNCPKWALMYLLLTNDFHGSSPEVNVHLPVWHMLHLMFVFFLIIFVVCSCPILVICDHLFKQSFQVPGFVPCAPDHRGLSLNKVANAFEPYPHGFRQTWRANNRN